MGVPPCLVSIHRCFWDFGLVGELGVRCGFGRLGRLTSLDFWPGLRCVHFGRAIAVFIIPGVDVVGLMRLLRGGDCFARGGDCFAVVGLMRLLVDPSCGWFVLKFYRRSS